MDCIRCNTNAVVISHERGATQRLFAAVQFFIMNAKVKPAVSIYSKSEIRFPETDSYYYVGTAGQKAFGRGDTIHRAHLSEAAFYDNFEKILAGISEAAEQGVIDIETTANGRGEFYDLWEKAKRGQSPYTPIFIPWFIDTEYSVENMTEEDRKGLSASIQELFEIPDKDFQLTKEEEALKKRAKAEYGIDLTNGQIKWRRYKLWDRGQLFFQEYPEDDISCFLQTGRSVFNHIITDKSLRIPLDDLSKWNATPAEKEELKKRILYAGLDGAEGTLTGDAHSFAVIDTNHPKAPQGKAVVIYEYTSNEPIDIFDQKVANICKAYKINLAVEKNGVGKAHIIKLAGLGIPWMFEWETNGTNRSVMITDLEEAYRKEELIETYPEAEDEARNMVYKDNNRAEHLDGKHDDRIFARMIAYQKLHGPRPGVI